MTPRARPGAPSVRMRTVSSRRRHCRSSLACARGESSLDQPASATSRRTLPRDPVRLRNCRGDHRDRYSRSAARRQLVCDPSGCREDGRGCVQPRDRAGGSRRRHLFGRRDRVSRPKRGDGGERRRLDFACRWAIRSAARADRERDRQSHPDSGHEGSRPHRNVRRHRGQPRARSLHRRDPRLERESDAAHPSPLRIARVDQSRRPRARHSECARPLCGLRPLRSEQKRDAANRPALPAQ